MINTRKFSIIGYSISCISFILATIDVCNKIYTNRIGNTNQIYVIVGIISFIVATISLRYFRYNKKRL